jgi:hypothetical protein
MQKSKQILATWLAHGSAYTLICMLLGSTILGPILSNSTPTLDNSLASNEAIVLTQSMLGSSVSSPVANTFETSIQANQIPLLATTGLLNTPTKSSQSSSTSTTSSSLVTPQGSSSSASLISPTNTPTPLPTPEPTPLPSPFRSTYPNSLMYFDSLSFNAEDGYYQAERHYNTIYQPLAQYGQTPVVLFEPDRGSFGTQGMWDGIDAYYKRLSQLMGSSKLGRQVPLPEANLHNVWGPNILPTAGEVKTFLSRYSGIMKTYFGDKKLTILLDGKTHVVSDTGWSNGTTVQFSEYIPSGVADTVYIEGFPWLTASGQNVFNASQFIPTQTINSQSGSLSALGINTVVFHTGVAVEKNIGGYTSITSDQSRIIMNDIVDVVSNYSSPFTIEISWFLENKINTAEGVNWDFPSQIGNLEYKDANARLQDNGIRVTEFR